MLAIRLPDEIEKRLDNLARRTRRTKTFYVREAILEHLDGLENLYSGGKALKQPQPAHSPGAPSFVSRWQGRFQPAAREDERYRLLAKKYL